MIKLENKEDLTADILRQLVHYDPETGIMTWKERDISWFNKGGYCGPLRNCNSWNGKNAGKEVGALHKSKCGYAKIKTRVMGNAYLLHRLVWLWMTGSFPDNEVDHINGVGTDNRWVNLRDVPHFENRRNSAKGRYGENARVGISYHSIDRKWVSSIGDKGKKVVLGSYDCYLDAVSARINAEKDLGYSSTHGRDISTRDNQES